MSAEIHNLSDYVVLDTIPDVLKPLTAWVVWRLTQKPGQKKPSKIPFYITGKMRDGIQGSDDDRAQLATFAKATAACVKGNYSGVGLAVLPDMGVVALDFDNCVVGGNITVSFISDLCTVTYCEYSPSGTGIRAFMRGSLPSRKDTTPKDGKFAVEVFGDSGFVTATGNVCEDCLMFGTEKTVSPITPEVMELFVERFGEPTINKAATGAEDDNDAWLLGLTPTQGWSKEQARRILFDCSADCGRQDWVFAGMALHVESMGAKWALDLYDEWSATGASYAGRADVEGRWRSFGKKAATGGAVIGGDWLIRHQQECLTRKKYTTVDAWKKEISAASDEFTLRERVAPKIKQDTSLADMDREALAQAMFDAFRGIGQKFPIAHCRKLLAQKRVVHVVVNESDESDEREMPHWCRGVCYVTEEDKYLIKGTEEWLTVQGFNAKNNRFMPRDENGMVTISASVAALELQQIQVVAMSRYVPWLPATFVMNGSSCVNTYKHDAVPTAAESMTKAGQWAVDKLLRHVNMLSSGRAEVAEMIMSWMAFCVQNPGRKIRWAILIKGIEGDGKSLLGGMLKAVMGSTNVKSVSPTVLATQFTGWAVGASVAVLEEIRMVGHSRYDIHNAMKQYITNDDIEIHPKGKDPYQAINTQNYIAFTNFNDALPLNDEDRRWMIVFSGFSEAKELHEALAKFGGTDAYFADLIDSFSAHAPMLRRFLLDYRLCDKFNPNGRAPMTDEKSQMVAMSVSDEEQLVAEIIKVGGVGITNNVVLSSCLRDQLTLADSELRIDNNHMNRILGKLGFTKYKDRVKFDGKTRVVYSKGRVTAWNPGMKQILDATLEKEVDGLVECSESSQLDVDLF
jgi:hypothetical protein